LISQGVHPLWGVKQVRGGKTSYFRAKCVNITRQMALTAAAYFKQVVNFSATCFHVELEQFSACVRVARVCQRQLGFLVFQDVLRALDP